MAKAAEKCSDPNILYQDRFVKVTKGLITIKTYYFPTGQSCHIDPSRIKALNYEKDPKFGALTKKGWGMSLSPVWWACDIKRNFRDKPYIAITLDVGENLDKGFTVERLHDFLSATVPILNPGTGVSDKLPY